MQISVLGTVTAPFGKTWWQGTVARWVRSAWSVWACWLVLPGLLAAQEAIISPELARQNPDFLLQGEYTSEGRGVQVVAQGAGKFLAVLYRGGLPGAGWDGSEREALEEDTAGVQQLIQDLQLQRIERVSPTLGAKPPAGAMVLFDGTPEKLAAHWQEGARMTEDGLLMQGCMTKDRFQDFSAHIEFLTPFMPAARGQARGNSGVYYQGRYETQVLDSFGLAGRNNETGGIYEVSDPRLNMCLPPLQWQTYDVDFTAARWNEAGEKIASARLTVRLNGVLVQQDVEIPGPTRAAPVGESPEPGPIYLQDHGNPVRFRNIWVLPRDVAREARRPLLPAFERFHGQGAELAVGGRLLASELGCVACHRDAPAELQQDRKQAPILSGVGSRVRPEWLLKYLSDPQQVKPGTTMPHLLGHLSADERTQAALKLTNFLASTGRLRHQTIDRGAATRGEQLFHQIGCTACHAPRNGTPVDPATAVSLAGIEEKYSLISLTEFLKNPHAVRPSGRMPQMLLKEKEPQELASYLLQDAPGLSLPPNVRYQVYLGDWNKLPDFEALTPARSGECVGFDVGVAGRLDRFAVRYETFIEIERRGRYTFHLGSDDGSRLFINGELVIDNDGIHPHQIASGGIQLEAGLHPLRVEYFEASGEESVTLEIEGRGLPRQDAVNRLSLTAEPQPAPPAEAGGFVFDASLVGAGQQIFRELGCASCHELRLGEERLQPLFAENRQPPVWSELRPGHGCLNDAAGPGVPQYFLSGQQISAVQEFLAQPVTPPTAREQLVQTLNVFNCWACHVRAGRGGPDAEHNPLFTTTIPEMGDEGRLPPPLDGVGDKLRDDWLRQVLQHGANERDYMRTRMPKFDAPQTVALAQPLIELDRKTAAPAVEIPEPEHRIKANGRVLVGEKGLACIKCHSFGPHRATGIQAISLTGMNRRLREDWFRRYLFEPQAYRPGTRMPTGYPGGVPAIADVYAEAPDQAAQAAWQIAAIWKYLEDGDRAGIPTGLIAEMIELQPTTAPIIYRNFIEGLTPRGIAVGYPERVNIAWDANTLALRRIWHGRFIDASKHWVGRGPGNQVPLGDHILAAEETVPIAQLSAQDADWPTGDPRQRGYQFLGYQLNSQKQPVFRYRSPYGIVTDAITPLVRDGGDAGLTRELTLTPEAAAEGLYVRLATASQIEQLGDRRYRLDSGLTITLLDAATPLLRTSRGQQELLVPLRSEAGPATVSYRLEW